MEKIRVGILGAAGYTGGELIRLLVHHPEAEIVFANSESNAGNLVADVHEGLLGDTDLRFTDAMPFDEVDVVFFCFGHGKSEAFLKEHTIPEHVKIIDLAQDFRIAFFCAMWFMGIGLGFYLILWLLAPKKA